MTFAHLHCHSSIGSMVDSMVSADQLFARAAELGQSAMAITDHGSMASVLDSYKAYKKHGVKYIPGCEAYFVNNLEDKKEKRKHLVLLAKNEVGYKNLLKINYLGFTNYQYVAMLNKVFPKVDWNILSEYREGIICLTGCSAGPIAYDLFTVEDGVWNQEACYLKALETISKLQDIYGEDLYLEVQPHNFFKYKTIRKTGEKELLKNGDPIILVDQKYLNKKLYQASKEMGISIVPTCDVHYCEKSDAKIHDMLLAINDKKPLSDPNRHKYSVQEFYVKTENEVLKYFSELFDFDTAVNICQETVRIANKCDPPNYIKLNETHLPRFDVTTDPEYDRFLKWHQKQKEEVPIDKSFMRYKCLQTFKKRTRSFSVNKKRFYKKRLMKEIKVLEDKDFSSYMLIVYDFIKYAREKGISIGPGRGSVGGSLVAYLLDIHVADPIKYDLIFERFHNSEKTSFPDIDTDIDPDGRGMIKHYLSQKYGESNVANVSNLSRITPKVAIKDIARSLELGGGKSEAFKIANQITKSIPDEARTLSDALNMSKDFANFVSKYPDVLMYGNGLSGLEKAYATHAAGLVIGDVDLTSFVPLRVDKNNQVSVQYEKERCEEMGLVKMDLLGLDHLRIIKNAIVNAKRIGEECPDPSDIPLDDSAVWSDIASGRTMCVFQMESDHMRKLCRQIQPENISDLSLVNALGRPSAKNSRGHYIRRRRGKEAITYDHECLRAPLQDTLGICVYEEQLAKLANMVAGWDLNKADGLRKLTKNKSKHPELAVALERDFINDASQYSKISKEEAGKIWTEVIEPFAGYGFNKSHGILYSINGYHSAYYKHYHPAAFMAAVLRSEVEKSSNVNTKVKTYKQEAEDLGIKINVPDVNKSDEYFSVLDERTIVMGLAIVKGVGAKAVENIIQTRGEHEFTSFADFLYRTKSSLVRKDVIRALANAGCFDQMGVTRKTAHERYADIRSKVNKIMDKSDIPAWVALKDFDMAEFAEEEWSKKEMLAGEMSTLGFYISGTINDLYDGFFTNQNVVFIKSIKRLANNTPIRIEAVVETVAQRKTTGGKRPGSAYGNCTVIDAHGDSVTMKIWPNQWSQVKNKIFDGTPIRAVCKVNIWNDLHTLILDRVEKIGVKQ